MKNVIVSTCGTSLFTANATTEIRKLMTNHANAKLASDIPAKDFETIKNHVSGCLEELVSLTCIDTLCRCSAEINGLASFYGRSLTGQDHHILMATDTWLGEQSAQAIASVLQRYGQSTEIKRVSDLRTDNLPAYRGALSEIVQWAYTCLPEYRRNGYGIIFNLTGGFKAVQGFMQTLGMLHADECVYVFERSDPASSCNLGMDLIGPSRGSIPRECAKLTLKSMTWLNTWKPNKTNYRWTSR